MTTRKAAPSTSPPTGPYWLIQHRNEFLESLALQGYAKGTIKSYRLMVDRLCAEAQARSLESDALDSRVLGELAIACPRTGTSYMERELARATRRFTDYLVHAGVIAPANPIPPPPGPTEQLCMELDGWLRHHRGMFGHRLRTYRNELQRIVAFCCTASGTVEDLASVTPEVIFALLDRDPGKGGWRLPYIRNILRFLFWSGRVPRDFAEAIPKLASKRPDGLPRHIEPGVVRMLLDAVRGQRPRDLRDYAMLLLMARLGLRAQEVIAIRLDDIDWEASRILIRGKNRQFDHLPIPVDVGEAIVAWVLGGSRGDSRHLFVSIRPPYARFTRSSNVLRALRRAYKWAGLIPLGGQARTHALRHGLAMQLLDTGSSLEEVGNVLRHRSAQSTTAYVQYDLDALRPLARRWPVGGESR